MKVHIIGGGIIGLSSAWYLAEAGFSVTVIDNTRLEDGTSHGNAGMVVPSHVVPLASPGVITQGLRWLLSSKSPFYIKPRLSLDLAQWLWRFYRSCTPENVRRAMPLLKDYNEWSRALYQEFAEHPAFDFAFERRGLLMMYRTEKTGHEEREVGEKAADMGIEVQLLDGEQVQALETGTRTAALGGVYYPGDAHLYPNRFLDQLIRQLKARGVQILTGRGVVDFRAENDRVQSLQMSDGMILPVESVVLAAGSWSGRILRRLGLKLLLQDGKGYSFTLPQPAERPLVPTILTEGKIAVSPLAEDLRIGGTLEISNLSEKVHRSRLQGIVESVPRYYPDLSIEPPDLQTVWHGYRPCSPDGLPYMGFSRKYPNLYIATGHAMMGMSMGPASGKLVAQMMTGQQPEIPVNLLSPERF